MKINKNDLQELRSSVDYLDAVVSDAEAKGDVSPATAGNAEFHTVLMGDIFNKIRMNRKQ